MSKLIAFILLLALCGCDEYQTQEQGNRIQFKDYNCNNHTPLSIVAVDSIEFLVNHRTGHMIKITSNESNN
jgi:hypothetical protein